ncbi:ABC transporter ATP-binding protein [Haloimpatiens lingqiaonensis]|uniref:ABC transporter ATP-binding protein n=1 Tax=Haloimpatiens lingqiaonensis TaxID=1380675 RepID=UPI0010FDE4A7|nr:ABC transporter ATP-binding protein [Haloimpatiens lingqiaonensis]
MLKVNNLYKKFGKFTAVDNLTFHVPEGEIFGFVGPNGAGKTTTMKIVAGLLKETSGQVYVNEIDALKDHRKVKEYIGYMPDFFGVYDNLKVSEYLDFYASIYEIYGKEKDKICDDLLELVDLSNKKGEYVDSLSRGMKQRLCLARSLIHNPKLLILDEPASGMDPRARFEMKEILKSLRDMGKTVIISSHILSELSEICTSIGIIDKGKMVANGKVEDIMMKLQSNKIIKMKMINRVEEAVRLLQEIPEITNVAPSGNSIEIAINGGDVEMQNILKKLIMNEIPLVSFGEESRKLEDVFMKVTERSEE